MTNAKNVKKWITFWNILYKDNWKSLQFKICLVYVFNSIFLFLHFLPISHSQFVFHRWLSPIEAEVGILLFTPPTICLHFISFLQITVLTQYLKTSPTLFIRNSWAESWCWCDSTISCCVPYWCSLTKQLNGPTVDGWQRQDLNTMF